MDVRSSVIFGVLLLGAAVGLMTWHVRSWRRGQSQKLSLDERDYRRRQYRRRMQCSALLAAVAVALVVGPLIPGPPLLVIGFYGVVVLLVFWMALLALMDVLATKYHFGRLRDRYLIERADGQSASLSFP